MNDKTESTRTTAGWKLLLLTASLGLAAFGCGADDQVALPASVAVVQPTDGAKVTSPVTFEFELENLTTGPTGEVVEGEGHMHIIVDVGCSPTGLVIPGPDETYIHWGDGSLKKEVELPPGEYDLCIQAGDGLHQALDATQTLSIEVVE